MPAVWSISSSGIRPREVSIYRFLKDARCPVRFVEGQTIQKGSSIRPPACIHATLGTRERLGGDRQGDLEIPRRQRIRRCHDCGVVGRDLMHSLFVGPLSQASLAERSDCVNEKVQNRSG
jgi:hypothetical protein